jgi:hypothetical protein
MEPPHTQSNALRITSLSFEASSLRTSARGFFERSARK